MTLAHLQEYACNNPNSVFGTDISRCVKWYKENSAVLNVFYDGLDFEKNTEKKAYTVRYFFDIRRSVRKPYAFRSPFLPVRSVLLSVV